MRLLLAIGCDVYDHEGQLTGAEADARRVFETLIRPEVGDYDSSRSRLLVSPTWQETQVALRDMLIGVDDVDTFTMFFAGHGGVANGSFYMLLRDSTPGAWSMSALSLSALFLTLNEVRPGQSNIIIDACESGGLIADLGLLLKPEIMGNEGTPAVTLLAMAAQDQAALETSEGGDGTRAMLDCLEGRDLVNDTAATFDLAQIGRHISTRLRAETGQSPVVWGLNLYGPPRFCRNPRFGADPTRPLREVVQAWPAGGEATVRAHYDDLWHAYASVSADWDPRSFARIVEPVFKELAEQPEALAAFVDRLAAALIDRARGVSDAFRPAQVIATLATCLVRYLDRPAIAREAESLQAAYVSAVLDAATRLSARLDSDRYALLSARGGGLSDLFYLPIRLAMVLGWTAASCMVAEGNPRRAEAESVFTRLLRQTLEHYSGSIQAMSDAQASSWVATIVQARRLGLVEEAETLVGLLFYSLATCRGGIARGDLPGDLVFDYLMARQKGEYGPVFESLERPPELSAVVLLAAARLHLDEAVDPALWELDGHNFQAFVTDDFASFGEEMIQSGENLMFEIGDQVFRLSDLVDRLDAQIPSPPTPDFERGALLASLVYPDRVPWYLLKRTAVSA